MLMDLTITPPEKALLLAALECFQEVDSECAGDLPGYLLDKATNYGRMDMPKSSEIEDLVKRIQEL